MNTLLANALVAVSLLAVSDLASARDSRPGTVITFDCNASTLPSQRDVASLLGTHNFSQTYAERTRLMQNVRRECLRGARQVLVKSDEPSLQTRTTELVKAH